MLLNIRHEVRYRTDARLAHLIQQLRLTPREEGGQAVWSWRLTAPGRQCTRLDPHGNLTHTVLLERPAEEIVIRVEGTVETPDEPVPLASEGLPPGAYLAPTPLTAYDAQIAEFARDRVRAGLDPMDGLYELMNGVHDHVAYRPPGNAHATARETYADRVGACRDRTQLFIAACLALGIPARYVSGYRPAWDQARVEAHAWADAWVEGLGWVGFDIHSNRLADGRLCRLAVGRDMLDTYPVFAVYSDEGAEVLQVFTQGGRASQ